MQGAALLDHETVGGAGHSRALISRGSVATGAGRGGTSRGEIAILALLRTLQDSRQAIGSRRPCRAPVGRRPGVVRFRLANPVALRATCTGRRYGVRS